jgi:hypothetical protein
MQRRGRELELLLKGRSDVSHARMRVLQDDFEPCAARRTVALSLRTQECLGGQYKQMKYAGYTRKWSMFHFLPVETSGHIRNSITVTLAVASYSVLGASRYLRSKCVARAGLALNTFHQQHHALAATFST